jgi:RNA polymerase sigma factor (TIGR02999 family)
MEQQGSNEPDGFTDAANGEVTTLLAAWGQGDEGAAERLLAVVYRELHLMADRMMRRERSEHTLQPTALVHEAFLRFDNQRQATWRDRGHFFAVAAQAMRRVLIDHARKRTYQKRGGDRVRVDLLEHDAVTWGRPEELLAVDRALERLAAIDADKARLVELRFFAGMSIEEAAAVLGVSRATTARSWRAARAFLQRELKQGSPA